MSEALEQLHSDLDFVKKYLEIETFLGKFSSIHIPDSFLQLQSNGLDDRQFHDVISEGHGISRSQIAKQGLQVMTGTLVLYIAGRFESYVRESIQVAAREIGNKCKQFDALPKNMKASLLSQTAAVMQNPRKYGHAEGGVKSFVKRLAEGYGLISDNNPVNYECISITDANMKPDVLRELCERIGMGDIWSDISTQAAMKKLFGTMDPNQVKIDAQARLTNLMNLRNSIAHPAASTTFPTSSAVTDDLAFIRALCTVIDSVFDTYVAVVKPVGQLHAP